MNKFKGKSILLIYPPRDKAVRSIHENLYFGLKSLGFKIDFLDIENPPEFCNSNLYDKLRNVYERKFKDNKQYIFIAEKNFYNRYFYSKLLELENQTDRFDYILVIKPEEFSAKFIKKLSAIGDQLVGYMWDALRLYFKPGLLKSRKYFHQLYSFDKNNIKNHPELNLKYLTNYYIPSDKSNIPYGQRAIDIFYIGALAGTLPEQRRDWKLNELTKYLNGNIEIKIHVDEKFLIEDKGILKNSKIQYITQPTSIDETLEKTRNSKIVIDICKNQHIGLSFRFFECLWFETKLITNNKDVVNYDFYNPQNIMVVDFDNLEVNDEIINQFQNEPYRKISEDLTKKYSLENWIKNVFEFGNYIPI